ncbi:acyl-CoA dehydrogenase family protein [Nocardioides convexus]|uniref:acyl-CoA dehydrogenase family protein n=1 Tax=Nocardioides convexus TaxID=2712224 RepID=UPI003101A913
MGIWALASIVGHGSEEAPGGASPCRPCAATSCGARLFSEPGAGSDLASLQTRATRVDGGWRINGQKIWTSMAQFSDWGILIARTNPTAPKHEGITYFLLDMSTEGVDVRPLREMTGSALFNEVFFDDVFIPDEYVVGEVDHGWQVTRTALASERVALSQKMEAYANDRDLLRFAGSHDLSPLARFRLGEFARREPGDRRPGRARRAQAACAAPTPRPRRVRAKLLAMGISQKIAEFIVAGPASPAPSRCPASAATTRSSRLLAGRATTIYGGTTEVQTNVIGERMLGLPRDAEPRLTEQGA